MLSAVLLALNVSLSLSGALDGSTSFDDGVKLYRALEYEQAVFRFQEVALTPDLATKDRATAFTWLGLAYAGAGDFDAAKRSFRDALRAHVDVALPPDTPPRVADLFDQVKRELSLPPSTTGAGTTGATGSTTGDTTTSATDGTSPSEPAATSPTAFPWSIVAIGGGVVALGGAAVLAAVSADAYAKASAPDAFQDDVVDALTTTNASLVGAIALGVVGGGLVVAGGALMTSE